MKGRDTLTDAAQPTPEAVQIGAGPGPEAIPKLVDRLCSLAKEEECISIDKLVRTIGSQGHAPLLMVAGLIMILPIGMIPGVGGALGILVAIIGLQMLFGHSGIWTPKFIGQREIPADKIERMADRVRPVMEWLQRKLRVRMEVLSGGRVSLSVIAVILIVSGGSLVILGAIPVATPLMGVPVVLFAFGLFARDGALVLAGYILCVIAAAALWALRSTVF